ncbi:MAG: thioredoxin-disulfide reductase [DPANN group archaeon]|nr:thioredoxin-disulfide reductase [DPANN group archaeon]
MAKVYDIIIIGAGPAGLTAAIYGVRAGRSVLVVGGKTPGGQLMLTTDVEDYPGFVDAVQGPELVQKMRGQASRLGAEFLDDNVTTVYFKKSPFTIETDEKKKFSAKSVIIAVGSAYKWLGIPSELKFKGNGISTCAVCDGYFFKNKDVAVIGGGDTAMREALFLSKICKTVSVIHRRNVLRAQAVLQERAKATKNIKWIWNSDVQEFLGDKKLSGVKIKNTKTHQTSTLKIDGAFVAIGHEPSTGFLKGQLETDSKGYVVVKGGYTETSAPGVFVAGDVRDFRYQQAITAAGFGCMAAMDADSYLHGFRSQSVAAKKI